MKKTTLYIFLLFLAAAICGLIIFDFNSSTQSENKANPYALNIEEYQEVDPALIHYKEIRNIRLKCDRPKAISYFNNQLFIGADSFMQVIDPLGNQLLKVDLPASPRCIYPTGEGNIYIAFQDHIGVFDHQGSPLAKWETLGEKTIITSLARKNNVLFAADAGNRRIIKISLTNGQVLGQFEGKTSFGARHGFIVPSPYFEVAVNEEGELWVVNPGKHAFENYTDEGELRAYWNKTDPNIEGFSGCCNPAHMALLPDGSFVTAEKGLVRIKVHKPSGELESVVAPPNKFKENGKAPDLAVSPEGTVYALDFDRKVVRIFEKKERGARDEESGG